MHFKTISDSSSEVGEDMMPFFGVDVEVAIFWASLRGLGDLKLFETGVALEG